MVQVCLGNPFKLKYKWQSLCEEVFDLLKPSKKRGSSLRVFSTMVKPTLGPADVMIYIIPNQDMSLVARHFDEWDEEPEAGFTHRREPCASEVYLDSEYAGETLPPDYVAKLIWHEIAHNKGKIGNKGLHGGTGLRKKTVTNRDTLDKDFDVPFMKKVLHAHVRQWTGGFDFD